MTTNHQKMDSAVSMLKSEEAIEHRAKSTVRRARAGVPSAANAVSLARAARGGDEGAFERLVVEVGPRLYRFLALRLGHDADARDALQETLIAAWQALPRLRKVDRYWPWLVGIAARKAVDVLRRRVPLERYATSADLASGQGHEPEGELLRALAKLPDASREVLLLRYLLGLSERETAAILGVAVGTVKSRAARARSQLADLLDTNHQTRGDGRDGSH